MGSIFDAISVRACLHFPITKSLIKSFSKYQSQDASLHGCPSHGSPMGPQCPPPRYVIEPRLRKYSKYTHAPKCSKYLLPVSNGQPRRQKDAATAAQRPAATAAQGVFSCHRCREHGRHNGREQSRHRGRDPDAALRSAGEEFPGGSATSLRA